MCDTFFYGYIIWYIGNAAHHCDAVVQQRLSEHEDKEHLLHLYLLKHSEHRYRVDGTNQRREEQHV